MMKYFYPVVGDLFQNDDVPIHRGQGLTKWFAE